MNETLTVEMTDEFQPGEYQDIFKVGGIEIRLGIDRV